MTKRSVAVLMALVVALLGFSSTAFAQNPGDITIVAIVKQSDPWFDDMELGINQFKADTGECLHVNTRIRRSCASDRYHGEPDCSASRCHYHCAK